jgi:hypothetical protein
LILRKNVEEFKNNPMEIVGNAFKIELIRHVFDQDINALYEISAFGRRFKCSKLKFHSEHSNSTISMNRSN